MAVICGVDGCKAGWVAVSKDLESGEVNWCLCGTVRDIALQSPAPRVIAIDIPIGLTEAGPRECDLAVRRMLGPVRGCSVFPAPIRPVLGAHDYAEACRIRFGIDGKKMSKQAFAIMPKIREVDTLLGESPPLREVFHEVHPELCFHSLAGGIPLVAGKRTREGAEKRLALLRPLFGVRLTEALKDRLILHCTEDDVVDGFAALWTAERILKGMAYSVPATPPTDALGLRMEMVV